MTTIRVDAHWTTWCGGGSHPRHGAILLLAIRSVGLLHAAAKGKEFSESVTRAKEAIWTAAENAATKISNHDARVQPS